MCTHTHENEQPKKGCSVNGVKKVIKRNSLNILTLVGAVFGIILGIILRHFEVPRHTVKIISFPGDIYIRAIYMLVVPILFSSVITGMTGMEAQKLGRTGLRITIFYLTTTFAASSLGVILGLVIKPGRAVQDVNATDVTQSASKNTYVNIFDVLLDIIRNLIPNNIIRSMIESETTTYDSEDVLNYTRESLLHNNMTIPPLEGQVTYTDGANFIGIILFSVAFGVALKQIGTEGELLNSCILGFNNAMMKLVHYVMLYTPIGVLFLIAGSVALARNFEESFAKLGILTLSIFAGLAIHFSILTAGNFLFTRTNPFRFISGLKSAMMVTFATCSSLAALPTTMRCMQQNNGLNKGIAGLVLPIGATVNMDGGAIACSLTVLYLAQLHNVTIGFGSALKIGFYSAFSSIGASAIPNSFFAAILIVLNTCGIPVEGLELLFTTEWFVDRFKTSLNVYGDCVGANLVETWNKNQDNRPNEKISNGEEVELDLEEPKSVTSDASSIVLDLQTAGQQEISPLNGRS